MTGGRFPRADLIAFAAIVVVAAVLRFWALDLGLPHLMTRPDEEVILFQAGAPASGTFDLKYGIYPSAYIYLTWLWGEVGLRVLRLLGAFPSGDYSAILLRHPARMLLLDRGLSAVAGVLTVVVLVAFARRHLGRCAALAAGALLATDFIHARDSHAAKPDVLMSLGVVVAIGLMAPLARRATVARGALVGAAIGLAMGMKYPAVLLLLPAYVAAVMGSDARGWRRLVPGAAFAAGFAAAATFLATSPDLFFNPETRNKVLSIVVLVFPQAFPGVTDTGAVPPGTVDIPVVRELLGWLRLPRRVLAAVRHGPAADAARRARAGVGLRVAPSDRDPVGGVRGVVLPRRRRVAGAAGALHDADRAAAAAAGRGHAGRGGAPPGARRRACRS